jgi:hypothetical protein
VITVDPERVKRYLGTPYIQGAPAEVMPGNREADQTPRWFAFTADFQKIVVGGVATEAQLKSILKGTPELDAALSHIL